MRYSELITEIFDTTEPVQFKPDNRGGYETSFNVGEASYYLTINDMLDRGYDIVFGYEGELPKDKTPVGNIGIMQSKSFQVFSKVINIIREFVDAHHPEYIRFSAYIEDGRPDLYRKMIKQLSKLYPSTVKEYNRGHKINFIITFENDVTESLIERSLSDVGVTQYFYVALSSSRLKDHIDESLRTFVFNGVRGISSSQKIFKSTLLSPMPHINDIQAILPAETTLKMNQIARVDYKNIDVLLADDSKILYRVFAARTSKQLLDTVASKFNFRFSKIRDQDFGKLRLDMLNFLHTVDLKVPLNNLEDYRMVYERIAISSKNPTLIKIFSKQNKTEAYELIRKAIMTTSEGYSHENEWFIKNDMLRCPTNTKFIVHKFKEDIELYDKIIECMKKYKYDFEIVDHVSEKY